MRFAPMCRIRGRRVGKDISCLIATNQRAGGDGFCSPVGAEYPVSGGSFAHNMAGRGQSRWSAPRTRVCDSWRKSPVGVPSPLAQPPPAPLPLFPSNCGARFGAIEPWAHATACALVGRSEGCTSRASPGRSAAVQHGVTDTPPDRFAAKVRDPSDVACLCTSGQSAASTAARNDRAARFAGSDIVVSKAHQHARTGQQSG